MGFFDGKLRGSESLFSNELALDVDYLPPVIKFRENQQQEIAVCIKPVFTGRPGRNLIISGSPGIGKTAAVRAVLREVEKESDDIYTVYINCWKKETAFKIASDLCEQVGYKWVHNKRSDELFDAAAAIINKQAAVIVLDEIDKLTDFSALYAILEDIQKKCVILITNNNEFLSEIDARVRSRLMAGMLDFKSYTMEETLGILQQRVDYAFIPKVMESRVLQILAKKTWEAADIRAGLFLLREAGLSAERAGVKKIEEKHANEAVTQFPNFMQKKTGDLDTETQQILGLIKKNSGTSTSEVFTLYQKEGGDKTFRTFQRKIKDLAEANLIRTKEVNKGSDEGRSTIVEFKTTLNDF